MDYTSALRLITTNDLIHGGTEPRRGRRCALDRPPRAVSLGCRIEGIWQALPSRWSPGSSRRSAGWSRRSAPSPRWWSPSSEPAAGRTPSPRGCSSRPPSGMAALPARQRARPKPTGTPFLVMELLEGDGLENVAKAAGPVPRDTVNVHSRQSAAGLDKAHGYVARDGQHQVTVSAFAMDVTEVTEVTVAQYHACVSVGACDPAPRLASSRARSSSAFVIGPRSRLRA